MRTPAFLVALLAAGTALAAAPDLGTDQQRRAGAELYAKNCSQCHGDKGDGRGVAAPFLLPKPRDFTSGKFKIRTTPSGALPTDTDLEHVIRVGMPYTAMPAWGDFSDEQVRDLVYAVKSFYPDFAKPERQPTPIDIPQPPAVTAESVEKGRKTYADLGCANCHGELGRGDGPSAPSLKDDFGNPIRPADLTRRWTFRGGATRQAIFRAFSTGLNGTPMPSFADSLNVEQRWDLVNYIDSLGDGDAANYATVVSAKKVARPIDLADTAKLFDGSDTAYFPLVGQIMQPGRDFHPAASGLAVRAVYNESEIAFEIRWHDMRADGTGRNAPDLAVPPAEDAGDAEAAKPAAEGSAGENPWGEAEAGPAPAKSEGGFWDEGGAAAPAAAAPAFSDAVAIQLPVEVPTTIRKPYFIFGDKENPVHLWFLDLAKGAPRLYLGRGSDALEALGARGLAASAAYDKGEWRAVFKRRLRANGEISFEEGGFVPIAFSVWDGGSGERGNKRALTTWWSLYLEPGEKQSPAGQMASWAVGILALELVFVGWARRRKNGAEPTAGGQHV